MSHLFKVLASNRELDEIIYKHLCPPYRNGYITMGQEQYVMPVNYLKMVDSIDEFELRDSDIIVSSHPKAGTTWLQEMVWMIMTDLDFKGGEENINGRFPFLEFSCLFDSKRLMIENKDFKPPLWRLDSVKFTNDIKYEPRFIKTHLPFTLLPKQILNNTRKPKILYVTRNPKDTCVSYYNHTLIIDGYSGTFEQFCRLFLAGKVTYGPFYEHVLSYWSNRHMDNMLILKYEDMKKDLRGVVIRVAEFLGKTLSDEQLDKLCVHLSFESMKKNPSVNREGLVTENKSLNLIKSGGAFIRSGTVGNYKQYMTPDIEKDFDDMTQVKMEGSGYSFE